MITILKTLLGSLWQGMGKPGAYVFLAGTTLVIDLFSPSIRHDFYIAICTVLYFLARILDAIEKQAGK